MFCYSSTTKRAIQVYLQQAMKLTQPIYFFSFCKNFNYILHFPSCFVWGLICVENVLNIHLLDSKKTGSFVKDSMFSTPQPDKHILPEHTHLLTSLCLLSKPEVFKLILSNHLKVLFVQLILFHLTPSGDFSFSSTWTQKTFLHCGTFPTTLITLVPFPQHLSRLE